MTTRFRLLALATIVALFSVQCTQPEEKQSKYPTSIEQNFKAGKITHNGGYLNYQECTTAPMDAGKAPLIIILHGQYANGSDNRSQLRQDAMIRIWHYFSSRSIKALLVAPQCPSSRSWDEQLQSDRASMPELVKALVEDFKANRNGLDTERIYIVGYSDSHKPAGAGGVWRLVSEYTDTFAAAIAVAGDPDEGVSAESVAKTPLLVIKGKTAAYAVALALDSFADAVHDEGGIFVEKFLSVGTRSEVCREAFSAETLNWLLQFKK